jgi:23S rRNA (adenine2503-C2)-methyltransferase
VRRRPWQEGSPQERPSGGERGRGVGAARPVAGAPSSQGSRPEARAPRARALPPLPEPAAPPPVLGPDGRELLAVAGMGPDELSRLLEGWGEPSYRGRQLFTWLQARAEADFLAMTPLPLALRRRLAEEAVASSLTPIARLVDRHDGTVKYLFRLADGETVETVLMRYRYGWTVCVSSQVGCRMGCRFCASTLGGLKRNLAAHEMVEQVLAVQRDLRDPARRRDPELFPVPEEPGEWADEEQEEEPEGELGEGEEGGDDQRFARVRRVVVMGMGEPMENLPAVLRFLRILHEPDGVAIGWRHMTVSTAGVVPGIDALAEERLPITLAVSLHAPNDELRDRLMPLNHRYPIAQVLEACRRYVARTHRRLTFEYVLIAGVNDLPEHARELARLIRDLRCHVNLIPWNPVPERDFRPSPPEAVARFRGLLQGAGIPVTVRRQLGLGVEGACGQLRRRLVPAGQP